MSDITLILQKMEQDDKQAADELLRAVYAELRPLAAGKMARKDPRSQLRGIANPRAGSPALQPAALWSHGDLAVGILPASRPSRSRTTGSRSTTSSGVLDPEGINPPGRPTPEFGLLEHASPLNREIGR